MEKLSQKHGIRHNSKHRLRPLPSNRNFQNKTWRYINTGKTQKQIRKMHRRRKYNNTTPNPKIKPNKIFGPKPMFIISNSIKMLINYKYTIYNFN